MDLVRCRYMGGPHSRTKGLGCYPTFYPGARIVRRGVGRSGGGQIMCEYYYLQPPSISGVWGFMSTAFNFVWPYVALGIGLAVTGMIVVIAIKIFRQLHGDEDQY